MTERIEIACWRIWSYLRVRGRCDPESIHVNIGITEDDADDALDLMDDLGMIENGDHPIRLMDGEDDGVPPFTAIFETRTHD